MRYEVGTVSYTHLDVYKRQAFTGVGVGDVVLLAGRDVQRLREDLPVAACLVQQVNEVRVLKNVLYFSGSQQILDILSNSGWDLCVIIGQLFICPSGDFSHFQRCVTSHPA